jgi:hypothetical protein
VSVISEAATLHPGLLARKGAAAPTVAPRLFSVYGPSSSDPVRIVPVGGDAAAVTRDVTMEGDERARVARVSFRLDQRRWLQLRITAAALGKSRQAMLVQAFDEFMERHVASASEQCRVLGDGNPQELPALGNECESRS